MRYCKQRDNFSCGPVAILNALIWSGIKLSYKYTKGIGYMCNCEPIQGTHPILFGQTLQKFEKDFGLFKVKKVYRPKLKQIEKHLKRGEIVIINYKIGINKRNGQWRHYTLVEGINKNGTKFNVVNAFGKGPAFQKVSRNQFKYEFLRYKKPLSTFQVWFLTKDRTGRPIKTSLDVYIAAKKNS